MDFAFHIKHFIFIVSSFILLTSECLWILDIGFIYKNLSNLFQFSGSLYLLIQIELKHWKEPYMGEISLSEFYKCLLLDTDIYIFDKH